MAKYAAQPAVRGSTHLKIAVMGPSGSGKTYSSLLIARGLAPKVNPRIVMIDTEGGSGSLYDDIYGPNERYDVFEIRDSFTAQHLVDVVTDFAKQGYDVVIVDSLSLFWSGPGGFLEMKAAVERQTGNGWTAWGQITPLWNQFLKDLREAKVHLIITMRSKTKWVVDAAAGNKPNKVGTEPDARDGIEYEFTTTFMLDQTHMAVGSKDRTTMFPTTLYFKPSIQTGQRFLEWHQGGAAAAAPAPAPVVAPATDDSGDLRAQYGAPPATPPPAPGPGAVDW